MSTLQQHLEHRTRTLAQMLLPEPGRETRNNATGPNAYVCIRDVILGDGTQIAAGERLYGHRGPHPAVGERPDCFARAGTPAANAANAKLQSRSKSRTAPTTRRKPYDRQQHRQEIDAARREIDEQKLEGELPRPAWALPSTRLLTPGEVAEFRADRCHRSVRLSSHARASIIDDAQSCPTHERGGGLVGWLDADTVYLFAASRTSPAARSGIRAFVPDLDGDFVWARQEQHTHGRHMRYVGSWHSHPNTNGDPSPHDLKFWSGLARETDDDIATPSELHVGLIIGMPNRARPVIEAFVTRRSDDFRKRLVCEPAEILRAA